jgi:hypothetical protein
MVTDNRSLVIILDNIERSECASSRAVQVSDKRFSSDDMIEFFRILMNFVQFFYTQIFSKDN